jgi:excinuclease ABC subunit A
MSEWKKDFIKKAKDFPIHKPYHQLTKEQKKYLWKGDGKSTFPSIDNFFKMLEENLYKIQYRVMLSVIAEKHFARLVKDCDCVKKQAG